MAVLLKDDLSQELPVLLADQEWLAALRVLPSVDSTNEVLKRWAAEGAEEWSVVVAEEQASGRAAGGRRWYSPSGGGLWLSALLRPGVQRGEAGILTLAAAVAAAEAVEEQAGLAPQIVWPGELQLSGRTFGGVFVEISYQGHRPSVAVVGVGMDVNLTALDLPPAVRLPTTSLVRALGRPVPRAELGRTLLVRLHERVEELRAGRLAAVLAAYVARAGGLGGEVTLVQGARRTEGRLMAIRADGGIELVLADGQLLVAHSGRLSLDRVRRER
ncbi:MAG: biotin--[acetyl-CoA-carboxylase] ligase [Bacillota bacterium]|nr:biotin--[acetyl-CoA-carboxylase] ligase [Bacillota bacterium]